MSTLGSQLDISLPGGSSQEFSLASFLPGLSTPQHHSVRGAATAGGSGGGASGGGAGGSGATRKAGSGTKGVTLTLRDQEKHIDNLKKENFSLKLRVHFLEDRLAQLAPDELDAAIKQNINLKIEVQERGVEIKKLKRLVKELESELKKAHQRGMMGGGSSSSIGGRERELEEKLEEREREIHDLRRRLRRDDDDTTSRLDSGTIGGSADEEALRLRNQELEDQLDETRALLEDNMIELERLKVMVEKGSSRSSTAVSGDGSEDGLNRSQRTLRKKIDELEDVNEELRVQLDEQGVLINRQDEEREDLLDEIDRLKLTVEDLQRRREAEIAERSQSRAQFLEERDQREAVEEEVNVMKDKIAALTIELQQREEEAERLSNEIRNLAEDHERDLALVEDEWRGEVEEARQRVEELKDVLAERDSESKELRIHISELETNTNDLHTKFEAALAHLEEEAQRKDEQLENLNRALDDLGHQVYVLEDENEGLKSESQRIKDDEAAERERLEALIAAFKEKIANLKAQLQQISDMYEASTEEINAHRERQEELAEHIERVVQELQREQKTRERLESELSASEKNREVDLRREKRALEAKESALQSALNELAKTQSLLSQRESDLQAVQGVLQSVEKESRRLGETHTTARFSLQLEVDRLKRDLERVEDELARTRKDLEDREAKTRDRDSTLDKLHAENRDLATQLAAQTQARLNVSEKLDTVQASLKTAESELEKFRTKVGELEQRLARDQRSLLAAEAQYRDQLTERNTLLLTIYQYMDKILGVDKTPKKGGQAETKPFTNFTVFHDNLITRLKSLSQIQLDFDKRSKEIENRFIEKLNDMKKQLDNRWRQIDKFEASVKQVAEMKSQWRKKFSAKEGELEALRNMNTDLTAQLSGTRKPGQSDPMELRSLTTRAINAERRLNNTQNQLIASEEKIAAINQRTVAADLKWEARVKEYESRLKQAEERVKRERQGGKERILELETNLKSLQRQLELAQKRNQQLTDIIDINKVALPHSSSNPSRPQ